MNPKPLSAIMVMLPGILQLHCMAQDDRPNPIKTAIPAIEYINNARVAAFGQIASVSSPFYKDAGMFQNPALLSKNKRSVGVISTLMRWYNTGYCDKCFRAEQDLYYSPDSNNTLGYRFYYYKGPEDGTWWGGTGSMIYPYEYMHQITWTHIFNKRFSAGAGLKYILSDPQHGEDNPYYQPAKIVAVDVGINYGNAFTLAEDLSVNFNTGAVINNFGKKVKTFENDLMGATRFIPVCLRLGVLVGPEWQFAEGKALSLDLAYQAEKLLVPTPPVYDYSNYPVVTMTGKDPDVSVFTALYSSFYDAPGGAEEELREILHKIAGELRLAVRDEFYVAIRSGRLMEHRTKGGRKHNFFGIGFGACGFSLDGLFIGAGGGSEFHSAYAFTLGYYTNLDGRRMRF